MHTDVKEVHSTHLASPLLSNLSMERAGVPSSVLLGRLSLRWAERSWEKEVGIDFGYHALGDLLLLQLCFLLNTYGITSWSPRYL